MSLLQHYDGLLLDLDGTIWEGGKPIAHAVETLSQTPAKSVYITNNAMRSPQEVAEKLQAIGLDASPGQVITSAQAAIELALQQYEPGTKVYVIGTPAFKDMAQQAGFIVVDSAADEPSVVLQGLDMSAGWAQLTEAALAIRQGATYLVSNTDATLPTERGMAIGNGSMVAAVISATGVVPSSAGKPQPTMFSQAVRDFELERPLAVGDRLDTDIEGANAAGIPTFHVLTGVSRGLDLIEAPKEQRPVYIADSLADLHKEASELMPGAQGGFTARWDGNDVLLERGEADSTPTQALRTVLEVVWARNKAPDFIRPASEAADRAANAW